MEIDIRKIRNSYGISKREFASLIGIKEVSYSSYEKRKELPSKYVYVLWKKLEDFPIPEDFFFYTSFVLETNMNYHNMTQIQIARMFGIANQSTISSYLKENIPMYEEKENFLKFDPFIIPVELNKTSDGYEKRLITDLIARGNFILVKKRKELLSSRKGEQN